MTNNLYFNPETGKTDTHSKKFNKREEKAYNLYLRDESRINDGGKFCEFTDYTFNILNSNTEGMSNNRNITKLKIAKNLSITPYKEIGGELAEGHYSLTPAKSLPVPMQKSLALAS